MPHLVIVGGGISGLALAYRLEQRMPTADVTVLEGSGRLGGAVCTFDEGPFRVEGGPNGFLDNKSATLDLCRDLGLGDRLVAASDTASRNRYVFLNGRLQALPTSLFAFLRSGVLSWRAKLSVLAERFRPPRWADDDESVADFFRRRLGNEIAEGLADALVTGIYAGDPSLLSVRATFPRMVAMERDHGGLFKGLAHAKKERGRQVAKGMAPARGSRMWSFPEGLRVLIDALADRLKRRPLSGVRVQTVCRSAEAPGWTVQAEGGGSWKADAVVLTCPAHEQATILHDLDASLADLVDGIAYNRVAVIALGYRRSDVPNPVDGFGYLVPKVSHRDVLGVQWCSSIFPDRAPEGSVLLRAMCGGSRRPEMVGWDDDRLVHAVQEELRTAMGITSEPVLRSVIRWEKAIPQYHLGHLERVAKIEAAVARHTGLFLGGSAYRGVALNDCCEQSSSLAGQIANSFQLS
jgi:oxygen-dependent protoporphyrinogen oxidase